MQNLNANLEKISIGVIKEIGTGVGSSASPLLLGTLE